jgi:peptidyl-prolyl cis-trans isomerase D
LTSALSLATLPRRRTTNEPPEAPSMLSYLRKNTQSWFARALLVLIAVVFIFFFGSGALNSPRTEMVAEVNGEAIRDRDLNRAWRREIQYRERFSQGGLSDTQRSALRETALQGLIDERLMRQAAFEEGLVVSDKEVQQSILNDAYFQNDEGNFDRTKYERSLGQKPEQEQKRLRKNIVQRLLVRKLDALVRSSVQVMESEVRETWERENSTRALDFIRVNSSKFRDEVELGDEEIAAFIEENSDDIAARYERDFASAYSSPKRVRARHILKKFDEEDDSESRAAARTAIEGLLGDARAEGADFAAMATEHSEDPGSASRGGDLGFFDNKRMAAPFTEAAFGLAAGGISEIVETQFGFHIIKVEEIQEAEEKTLESVQGDIAAILAKEAKAPDLAREFAQSLVAVLDGTLDTEAGEALLDSRNLRIQQTREFNLSARAIPKLGRAPKAMTAVAGLSGVGAVTAQPVAIPTGWAVLKLTERSDPSEDDYSADADGIRRRLLLAKETRALDGYTSALKESAKIWVAPGS